MTDDRRAGDVPTMGVRERQREETHRRLFDCSLEVFRRDGFVASKIDDIAKLAGVSRGTFYFHFPTKDDVLLELLAEVEGRNAAAVNALPDDAPLDTVLSTFLDSMAAGWENDPKLFPDLAVVALRTRANSGIENIDADPVRSTLSEVFTRSAQRGELQGVLPPSVLSDFFLANALAGALGWAANPELMGLRSVLEAVAQIFLHGTQGKRE